MFFKRRDEPGAVPAKAVAAEAHAPLLGEQLRRGVDPTALGFTTTSELEPATALIGQERALKAVDLGASIRQRDFNIFVLGPSASGKTTAIRSYLQDKAALRSPPKDWVYVNNFDNPIKPRAIALAPGRARLLERGMSGVVDELHTSLPALFESDDVQARRRAIDEAVRSEQERAFEVFSHKAQLQNVALLRTPNGFALAPVHEGEVIKPEVFNALGDAERHEIETRLETLNKELEAVVEQIPKRERDRRARHRQLNEEIAEVAVRQALDELQTEFAQDAEVADYLGRAHRDLVQNAARLMTATDDESEEIRQPLDSTRNGQFRRWMVNVVVGDGPRSAPIVEELNPTHGNLLGRVEHVAQMGTLLTDFLLIKPGALHRANGGYLLLDARRLLLSPFAWESLKTALKSHEIRIEPPSELSGLITTQSLDPDSIPLDVKVVLFGDRLLYYLLAEYDPDFLRLFKVQADFDDSAEWSEANHFAFARLIASIVKRHELRPVDAAGVGRMIEEAARMTEDTARLSVEIGRLADILREADHYAGVAERKVITRQDVALAISEATRRADRLRDKAQEGIQRDILRIATEGSSVGQINGLSVLSLGQFSFGRPSRITARVRMGRGRIVDIEREVELGGPLHSKGVMILWGFLAGRYAEDVPLALAASLVFEQSYGGVEGDSASSAELYALLSALSEVPIRQGLAVTGSVDQLGVVQAIGGVNDKIEGFFDVCRKRGLTGEQGVLIPKSNVQHLMLREDVVAAAREGKFFIYPVETIDQGIEILTGVAAGARGGDGRFPAGTINARVEERLLAFARKAQAFESEHAKAGDASKEGSV